MDTAQQQPELMSPAAIPGIDVKWIVRKIIMNMLSIDTVNETQNAYAHSLFIIRDRLWFTREYGMGVRIDVPTWKRWRENVAMRGAVVRGTWNGENWSYKVEAQMVDAVLRDLATGESHRDVADWWRMFQVGD